MHSFANACYNCGVAMGCISATGTRTQVARVRAEYPNQLDYSGLVAASKIQILNCNQLGINSQSNAKRCLLEAAVHRSLHIFSYNVFNRQQFKSQKPPCIAATFCHWKIYGRPAQSLRRWAGRTPDKAALPRTWKVQDLCVL